MLSGFPNSEPLVGRRVPVLGKFRPADELHFAALGFDDAGFNQPIDGRVLGLAERLGDAEGFLLHSKLIEPSESPARVGVKIAFLFSQYFVKNLVDET